MAVLEVYEYPHPVLKKKAVKVEKVDDALRKLMDDMLETMYSAVGVGLAAPQIGQSEVERFEKIRVRYLDYDGKEQEVLADDFLAIVLQHEMDHLDGILYIDRISRLKRNMLLKKLARFREEEKEDN